MNTPESLLPTGHKCVADCRTGVSTTEELNIEERRQRLEDTLRHYCTAFKKRYSPFYHAKVYFLNVRRKIELIRFKLAIADVTLSHAAIEQDLKNELLYEWEIPATITRANKPPLLTNRLHGERLTKVFKQVIKAHFAPTEFQKSFSSWAKQFTAASKERNDTLKATYSFDLEKGKIIKVNFEHFYDDEKKQNIAYVEFVDSWLQKIDYRNVKALARRLEKLHLELRKINGKIKMDKMRVYSSLFSKAGDTAPAYAVKNPYYYLEEIRQAKEKA